MKAVSAKAIQSTRSGAPSPFQLLGLLAGIAVLLILGPACGFGGGSYTPPPTPAPPQIPNVDLQPDRKPTQAFISRWLLKDIGFASGSGSLYLATNRTLELFDWDTLARHALITFGAPNPQLTTLSVQKDVGRLAIGLVDGTITLFQTNNLAAGKSLGTPGQGAIRCLVLSPDAIHVASSTTNAIEVWEISTGQKVFSSNIHLNDINALAYSPDGKLLASAGDDKTVKIWNAITGELIANLPKPGRVFGVAFSPDGKSIASAGVGGVFVTDLKGAGLFHSAEEEQGLPLKVAFTKDGFHLLVSSDLPVPSAPDIGIVLNFDLSRKSRTTAFVAHQGHTNVFHLSPDGKLLATEGTDGYIRIWRVD